MNKNKLFKIVIVLAVVLFVGFASLGFYRKYEKNKTAEAIERINSRTITMADVMGENLPPKPDQMLNDSTIAGFDVNNNGIRDDVELAIFEKYPNSAKIRAGMLQYAQVLQLQLIEVFNSKTLIKTIQERSLAYGCLGDVNYKDLKTNEKLIEELVLNTDLRIRARENTYEYMTTYSLTNEENCDIDFASLPN